MFVNSDLEEELRDTAEDLFNLDLGTNGGDSGMQIITRRINYFPVRGAPLDVPTAIHVILTVLEPGTQLSTITASLSANQQDGEVVAMLAPEMNVAHHIIPHKKLTRHNSSTAEMLAIVIQEFLSQTETDNDPFKPRPVSKGKFSLSHRGHISGIDGPLDPTQLGFPPDNAGDKSFAPQGRGFQREWHCSMLHRYFLLLGGTNSKEPSFTRI